MNDTANLLHPRQVTELKETKAQLEAMLSSPPHVRNQLADGGAHVQKQLNGVDRMMSQAPQPFSHDEIDGAVKREAALRTSWLDGMPTQAEMRRNSSGCVDKNMRWELNHKTDVLKWKHLRRRLHATGISEHRLANEGDVSNIETFRPRGGSGEVNFDDAQIPGKSIHLPPPGAAPAAVMSEEDSALLEDLNPELHGQMAVLNNEERAKVMALLESFKNLGEPGPSIPSKNEPQIRPGDELYVNKPKKPRKPRPGYTESEFGLLRAEAKSRGINSYGMSTADLRMAIAQAKVTENKAAVGA